MRGFSSIAAGLAMILSFIFSNIGSVAQAAGEASGKQCPALFKPIPPPKPTVTYRIAQDLGWPHPKPDTATSSDIVDPNGTPFTKRPTLLLAGPKTSPANIVVAGSTKVFNPKDVVDVLGGKGEIAKGLKVIYEQMLEQGPDRFLILPKSLEVLDPLYETMPNFKPALDQIKKSLAISMAAGEPVHFPPIILLGNPGVGKTHFANALAEALGTGFEFISMSSMTAGWVLSGSSSQWKDARMGKVAKSLLDGKYANPVVIVDEIDKASGSNQYDPMGSLYSLWEGKTSKAFVDEHLEIPLDTSHINWIATANDITKIPEPILSRAIVINIEAPNKQQLRNVVASVFKAELEKHPKLKFSNMITDDVFELLSNLVPRDIRKVLEDAIGNAVINNRSEITKEDVNLKLLNTSQEKRPIGFTN